ncbi:MAG: Rrf2 family transcriptional regulator [Bacillota bacterium]|nr:Rrf2 family transcriptional regulator [Bacillota bacterium]
MRITQEADYAIRIIYVLSRCGGKCDAKTISEEVKVPIRFTLKILRKLLQNGIVNSIKGAGGGYILKKSPSEISVKDVIESVNGPICISKCLYSDHPCTRLEGEKNTCPFHKLFEQVNSEITEEFADFTFDKVNK